MYLNLLLLVSVGVALASPVDEPSKRQEISLLPSFDNAENQGLDLSSIFDKIKNSPWWELLQQTFKPGTKPSKRQQISQLPALDNSLNQGLDLSSIFDKFQNSPWYQLLQQALKPVTGNVGTSGSSQSSAQAKSAVCGESSLNTDASHFIVDGTTANEGEFPWQCYLSTGSGSFSCGCSLISTSPVRALTAAHCVSNGPQSNLYVTFGALRRSDSPGAKRLEATEVVRHSSYNYYTMANDVAIIKFENNQNLTSTSAKPICLPSAETITGRVIVSGWGTEESGGQLTDDLKYVEKEFMTRTKCHRKTSYNKADILADMVCALEEGKDSCQGDSGGPMVIKNGNKFEQVGVVSWGYGCADPNYPGVYASVFYHLPWIKNNM